MSGVGTADELLARLRALADAGEVAAALNLALREAPHFPERATLLTYRILTLAVATGDLNRALDLFTRVVDGGFWFEPAQLRGDQAFAPLVGHADFEALLMVCEVRYAEASATAQPEVLLYSPESAPPYPVLVALHGNSNAAGPSAAHWDTAVGRGWMLALPQSSQIVGHEAYVWDDRRRGAADVKHVMATLPDADPARVVMAGFSMGGTLAVWLALDPDSQARGFVAVGPYIPDAAGWEPLVAAAAGSGLRGYLMAGADDIACLEGARTLQALMQRYALPVQLQIHQNVGHDFPPRFDMMLARALDFIMEDGA